VQLLSINLDDLRKQAADVTARIRKQQGGRPVIFLRAHVLCRHAF